MKHTISIKNRYVGDVVLDEFVNDIDDRLIQSRGDQIFVGTNIEICKRLPKHLRLLDVDSYEFENPILCEDTCNMMVARVWVGINQRNAPRARLEHSTTCFVQGLGGIN